MTRYLILCAGVGYRWHDYLGVRKQLLPLEGEPILHRTVRQLQGKGNGEVIVVAPDLPGYHLEGAGLFTPSKADPTGVQVDKLLSSREIWNEDGPTVCMWGDVWWSDEAIEQMTAWDGEGWHSWYRPGVSHTTGTGNGEYFAIGFDPSNHAKVEGACQRVIDLHNRNLIPWQNTGAWSHYRAMLDLPDPMIHGWHDGRNATLIDDWTDDFDHPGDYRTWYGRRMAGRYRVQACPYSWSWPASDDPQAIVHVDQDLRLPDDSFWCAVAHAVENDCRVVPYSQVEPRANYPEWEARSIEKVADPLVTIEPVGGGSGELVQLSGPVFV